jgi:nucleotide-binding universal stress UspA family protein
MYKKILVPIDGSENSIFVQEHAAKLAQLSGAQLTLLHVLDLPPQLKSLESYNLIKEQLEEKGQKIIEEAKARCNGYNITCIDKIAVGVPEDEIIKEEQQGGYDLIVVGSRGLGEVKSWILGSVSRRVIRYARCPVTVVKS